MVNVGRNLPWMVWVHVVSDWLASPSWRSWRCLQCLVNKIWAIWRPRKTGLVWTFRWIQLPQNTLEVKDKRSWFLDVFFAATMFWCSGISFERVSWGVSFRILSCLFYETISLPSYTPEVGSYFIQFFLPANQLAPSQEPTPSQKILPHVPSSWNRCRLNHRTVLETFKLPELSSSTNISGDEQGCRFDPS